MQKIVDGGFIFDDLIGKRVGRLHIFPIIVHTDDFFGLNGVQTIISEEFQNMLIDRLIKRHQVNDVTLMHLQDIIDIHFLVQSGKSTFKDLMIDYFAKKKSVIKRGKSPRNQQDLFDRYSGFRSTVANILPSYTDQSALMVRLKKILGF